MADAKELQAQYDLQMQINKVLESRQAILASQQKALSSQVQLAVDMCKALKCEELDKVEERLKSTQAAMAAAATEAGKLKGGLEGAAEAGRKAGDQTSSAGNRLNESFKTSNLTLAGFGLGIMQFGGIFMQTFKNVISMAGGLVTTLAKVGFAIFTLPFKLLGNLMDLAQSQGGGGPPPTLLALEKIRAELGGLNTAVGKAAASSLPQFRAQLKNMADTGLSVRKVFGQGREGLAKAMEYNLELFKALGPAAERFSGALQKSAVELAMYRKGLGITAESQAQIIRLGDLMGKSPTESMREFSSMAINMGDAFGISASVIGKDMAEMKADFANFGTLSTRELGQAAVYAHKLGIEVKALQGLIGQFDDFENAAQNAAKLSQAFGMNVDAMKMMQAQNPAERLSMLQQAFRETGKSVESMQRQELKLLATQAGLTEEQAYMAFSQKGLAQSYDQITKAGGKAEKKQLSQAEAMAKLADSIERVFGSGGGAKFQGFFDAFSKGFQSGILRTKEFRGLFRDIRRSLKSAYWAGRAVGKMFVEMFPGVRQMIGGLRDLFNPAKWSVMMERVKVIFRNFFTDLQTDPKAGAERFIENMKNLFKDFFGQKGGAISTIVEGGKTFLKAIGGIFMAVAPMVLDAFVDAINTIADFLEAPPAIPAAVTELGNQLWEALTRVFNILVDRLWPPIKRMFGALWEKVGPYIEEVAWRVFQVSLFKAFIRGVIGGLGGAAIAFLKDRLISIFKSVPTPPAPAPTEGAPTNPAAAARMVPALLTFMAAIGVLLLAFAAVVVIYKTANLKPEDALAIGAVVVALAGSAAMMSVALKFVPDNVAQDASKLSAVLVMMGAAATAALVTMAILSTVPVPSVGQILAFTTVMTTLVLSTLPLIIAAAIASKAPVGEATKGMLILGGFMLALGALGAGITWLLGKATPNPAGVAALMEGISSIMRTTMLMLPVALALGLAASAAPFGPIGLAAVVGGFEIIAGLSTLLISTLMPTINQLSQIRIANPASFRAVTSALVDIMQAVNGFVMALAGLAFMLRPSGSSVNPDAFRQNIESFRTLVDAILNSGIGQIIRELTFFAQNARVKEGTAEVISGIASVLGSVAQLMQSFGPTEASGQAIVAIATSPFTTGQDSVNMMTHIENGLMIARGSLARLLPVIKDFMVDTISGLGTIPAGAKDIGPFIQGMASMLGAVAGIMKAMSPSDAAFSAITEAADTWGADEVALTDKIFEGMKNTSEGIVKLLKGVQGPLVSMISGMMQALQPVLTSAASVDPQVLSSVGQILSGVMGAVSSIMDIFISMMETANERAAEFEGAVAQETAFNSILTNITSLFATIGPSLVSLVDPMKTMINAIIAIAQGITNTRGLKTRIEAVTAALAAVGQMSQIFGPDGPFYGAPPPNSTVPVNLITGMVTMMGDVASRILMPGGSLQQVVNAFDAIVVKNPRSLKSKAEALTAVFSGIQALSTAMQAMNNTGSAGLGALAQTFNERLGGAVGVQDITGAMTDMAYILSVVPRTVEGASSRVQAMVQAYTALQTALSTPLENVDAIVTLNNSLREGTLTVRHDGLPPINMSVTINVSAQQIAEAILRVNNTTDLPRERFQTTNA